MACVENIQPINADSEMEEGEIVDDLSDISSEEEFLLRQRLQVLENYNNVLERKKAKRSSVAPGTKRKKEDPLLYDLSEISATELEDYNCTHTTHRNVKEQRHIKSHHRQKRKKEEPVTSVRNKEYKKKNHRNKRKLEVKVISETSDESEDEYRNRRRKLADAVHVNKDKNEQTLNEKTSLSARLKKMLCPDVPEPVKFAENRIETDINIVQNNNPKAEDDVFYPISKIDDPVLSPISSTNADDHILSSDLQDINQTEQVTKNQSEPIDLCTDEDVKTIESSEQPQDSVDSGVIEHIKPNNTHSDKDSDEDLELLRQHALRTKVPKLKKKYEERIQPENKILSEDEDSDTTELRLICLKSALLKKAIEMKRKQKMKKRLSQSSNLCDELLDGQEMFNKNNNSDNNTDIESVDMEMGSDVDEKNKEVADDSAKADTIEQNVTEVTKAIENNISNALNTLSCPKEDELEEDEDLLRAKLLTSLSKNLSNLVNPNIMNTIEKIEETVNNIPKAPQLENIPEEKRFIIKLGESDSEGEHEATKNLTKMHMKLSEQIDFQQRLDMFLKSTRMAVENSKLPDVVQQPVTPKKNEKFVAKTVKHLPKSEQIEYKNLVKRMAELEKMKQARQSTMIMAHKPLMKDTLKPRNVTIDTKLTFNLEEQINLSRKKIAEESAKMLKLREEGKKMSQKYKIVATELRNIKTALTLNKKQQITVQNYLTKIRLQHQMLLKSSTTSKHSKTNGHLASRNIHNMSLQKENNPAKDEYKNPLVLKTVKVSVANDIKAEPKPPLKLIHPVLSVQIDVNSNKKVVKMPNSKSESDKNNSGEDRSNDLHESKNVSSHPLVEKGGGSNKDILSACDRKTVKDVDDYKSPLDALGNTDWEGDPNAILCPFEVDGDCKDPDCKYLHTTTHSQ